MSARRVLGLTLAVFATAASPATGHDHAAGLPVLRHTAPVDLTVYRDCEWFATYGPWKQAAGSADAPACRVLTCKGFRIRAKSCRLMPYMLGFRRSWE